MIMNNNYSTKADGGSSFCQYASLTGGSQIIDPYTGLQATYSNFCSY